MALFRRNKRSDNSDNSSGDATPKKEKGSWKKPASKFRNACLIVHSLMYNFVVHRYCFQAATTQGMATNIDSQDRSAYSLDHWRSIRTYRWLVDMG